MAPKEAAAHRVVLPTLGENNAARERLAADRAHWERVARKRAMVLENVYLDYDVPEELQRLAPGPSARRFSRRKKPWQGS